MPEKKPTSDQLREAAQRRLQDLNGQLGPVNEAAEDLVRKATGKRRPSGRGRGVTSGKFPRGWIKDQLGQIARGGGPEAGRAGDLLDEIKGIEKEIDEIQRDVGRAHWPKEPRKEKPQKPQKFDKAADITQKGSKAPPKSATPPVTKTAPVSKAVTEGGEAAGKRGLLARVGGKVGWKVLNALVPDPLDIAALPLELLISFAKSFQEGREQIRRRNLQHGFAIGWAAYLVVPRWEWAKWFADTYVDKDVATQILGAVGIAENAFNEGLARGFMYGERHSTGQTDRVRQRAFTALEKAGRTPGRDLGGGKYQFGRDDVYAFAAALLPAAQAALKESDRRRKYVRRLGEDVQRIGKKEVSIQEGITGEEVTRGVWINWAGGKRLALIRDYPGLGRKFLGWVPENMRPLVINETERKVGALETISVKSIHHKGSIRDEWAIAAEIAAEKRAREAQESRQREARTKEVLAEVEKLIYKQQPVGTSGRLVIRASVGEKGANRPDDVRRVSGRLHALGFLPAATADVEAVTAAIEDYQLRVLKLKRADGRVDPGGKTHQALIVGRRVTTSMALPKG